MAPAAADPYKDESGHGKRRHGGREYKDHASRAPVYEAPAYAGPPPGVVVQPPAVVIQPPAIVVRPYARKPWPGPARRAGPIF
jgi:hypothetical protein